MKVSFVGNPFEPHKREEIHAGHMGGPVSLIDVIPGVEFINPDYVSIWRNGSRLSGPFDEHLTVTAGAQDWFVVVRSPGLPAATPAVLVFLFNVAVSIAASLVLGLILKPPDRAQDKVDQGPTYGFSGITSQRSEGRPQQVIYGRIRAGGTLISEVIDNTHNAWGASTYRAQIAYGEGPIYAIADISTETPDDDPLQSGEPGREVPSQIEIEGNPASGIADVQAWLRLGSLEQSHVPTFNFSESRTEIGTPIYAPTDSAENGTTPLITLGSTTQSDQDDFLDEYGVITDLATEADSVRVTLRFPSGYFRTSGGNVVGRWWSCFIRYIRLSGGSPVAVGGDFSDGWVRKQMPIQAINSSSPFSIEYHVSLLNPVGYIPVPLGRALEGTYTATATGCNVNNPLYPAIWSGATTVPDFTFSTWARLTDVVPGTGVYAEFARHGDIASAGEYSYQRGWRFAFVERIYDTAPDFQVTRIVPQLEFWNAGVATRIFEGRGEPYHTPSWWAADGVETVHHFAVTFKEDIGNGQSRARIFVDGEMLTEYVGAWTTVFPSAADDIILITNTADIGGTGSYVVPLMLDEAWYYAEERSIDDIFSEFNNGAGMVGSTSTASDPNQYQILDPNKLVFGYHFNDNVGWGNYADDFGPLGNDLYIAFGADTQGDFIIEGRTSQNSLLRDTYRIEVMRNIPDSTDTTVFDDDVELEAVSSVLDSRFTYPTTPYLSLTVPAQEQLGTNIPGITSVVSGRILPQWLGGDPKNPEWTYAWSRNPAWVVLDRLTNERYGLGQFFGPKQIDVLSFLDWALYCDEAVYDLRNSYVIGEVAPADGYYDLHYDSSVAGETQFDGRGRLKFLVSATLMAAVDWKVGAFVGFVGEFEVVGFLAWTQTHAGGGGYEIERLEWNGTAWNVWCYYDRINEGAPWTDGTYLSAAAGFPGDYNGTAEGRIRRHTYDAVHDTAESDWETIQQVAAIGRAVVLLEGNKVRSRVNKPRDPVGVVSMGTILPGTFEVDYGGPAERENAYTIEFLDEDANWERKPAYVEHSSVQSAGDLDDIRHDALFVRGITRRAAALRHGQFMLNINQSVNRTGKFKASVSAIHYEVGDVLVLHHDVLEWGQGGRVYETGSTAAQLKIDREVVIAPATTYYADVIDANSGAMSTATISSIANTYNKGSTLTLSGAGFDFKAQKSQAYVVYSATERVLVEVVNIELTKDLEVEVQWIEYDSSVYDDVTEDIDTLANTSTGDSSSDTHLQEQVQVERCVAQVALGGSGDDEVRITGGWRIPIGSRDRGSRVALWTRLSTAITDSNIWELRTEGPLSDGTATFILSDARIGELYDVAFQTISPGGQRRSPERSPHRRVFVGSDAFRADPPTSFSATMEAGKATYRVSPAANASGCFHEIRRGGWVLGQVVAILKPGECCSEPTLNWASGAMNDAGRQVPTLYCRSMTPSGRYSAEATELAFDPEPSFGMDIRETGGTLEFFEDESWEDFGTGWTRVTPPGTTLTNLQIVTEASAPTYDPLPSAKHLAFTGSNLTGEFYTANSWPTLTNTVWKPEWYHVEFFVDGYQVHPTPFAHNTGRVNAWSALRVTSEGPLDLLPDEPANVSVLIEIKSIQTPDGVWSDWQTFTPGEYFGALFYFRVTFTRPDDTYDIVIHRMHQRFRRVNRVRWERSPANRVLTQDLLP